MFPPRMSFSEKVAEVCAFATICLAIYAMIIAFTGHEERRGAHAAPSHVAQGR